MSDRQMSLPRGDGEATTVPVPPPSGWRQLPADPQEAVLLSNDVLGVRVWGPPDQPTLSVGKSDLWDRRWFGDRQPPVPLDRIRELAHSGRLEEIARNPNDTIYSSAYRYDFPCPKPGAQLILGVPFAQRTEVALDAAGACWLRTAGAGKRLQARIWVPLEHVLVVVELYPDEVAGADLWVRVFRHRDTILPGQPVDPTLGGETAPGSFEPMAPPRCWVSANQGASGQGASGQSASSQGASGQPARSQPAAGRARTFGVVQDFPAESSFPEGFRAAVLATADRPTLAVEQREEAVGLGTPLWAAQEGRLSHGVVKRYGPLNASPGAAATVRFGPGPLPEAVLATVQTTQDGQPPEAAADGVLRAALALGLPGLRRQELEARARAVRQHPARASVWLGPPELQAPPRTTAGTATAAADIVLEAPDLVAPALRQAGGLYGDVPLCSVGSTKWWFQDAGLWHNDFHLNEIRAEPALTLGEFEQVRAFAELIHTLLPQACENAQDAYGLPGAMYPLVHFPLRCRGVAHTNLTWELDLGLNGLVAKPLWLYYRYTGDREFLAQVAYPVLAEGARFCAAYLTEGSDALLHLAPTVSPEHWGITPNFGRNRDCTSALTLTRYLLRAAAQAARLLGRDADQAAAWESKAGRLAPYPTWDSPAGPVWVDVADAPPIEYNIAVPLSPVFWGDDVGQDSAPAVLDLAHRTLAQIRVWEPHRFYLDRYVRPRLGLPPEEAGNLGPENLLLSYQSIRLFPAVPPAAQIEMRDFRAEGGFRVSARRQAGQTTDVRLGSELGNPCRLAHPWPGHAVEVRQSGAGVVGGASVAATHVAFATQAGAQYAVRPTDG